MSTDTRHPQYDDATLLAVMDDACQETHTKHPEVGGTILLASDFNTVAWPAEKPARLALARGLLARLPEPTPPTADGKTPGQIIYEVMNSDNCAIPYDVKLVGKFWEECASAVLAAFGGSGKSPIAASYEDIAEKLCSLGWTASNDAQWEGLRDALPELYSMLGGAGLEQAIARMEAVQFSESPVDYVSIASVRTRLIAAAREGHGPAAVDWKAKYEEESKDANELEQRTNEQAAKIQELFARAEKAEAELARIVAAAHEAGWNGTENSKDLAQFIKDQDETLEKWADYIHPEQHDRIVKSVQDRAKAAIAEARQEGLSTLRPIAEAGEVPAGAVRFLGYKDEDGEWLLGNFESQDNNPDTHFADILLPPQAKAPAVEAAEPTPAQAPPPWQPAVGEPVRLVSGGWPMAVGKVESDIDRITTVWMDAQGQPQQASYPAACLVSAKEAQP